MKKYEAVFILDDRKLDDRGDAFSREVAAHVTELGGQVVERNSLGRKQFARKIKKRSAGVYWDFVIELEPDKVGLLEDRYRLNQAVLRVVVFNYEPPPAGDSRERDDGRRSSRGRRQ